MQLGYPSQAVYRTSRKHKKLLNEKRQRESLEKEDTQYDVIFRAKSKPFKDAIKVIYPEDGSGPVLTFRNMGRVLSKPSTAC